MIDLHVTEDGDVETIRDTVRQGTAVAPELASRIRDIVTEEAEAALDGTAGDGVDLSIDVAFVTDRVPGAPRERIAVTLDFEGDDATVAAVDDAVAPPHRAQMADALEEATVSFLTQRSLAEGVELTVSVTPVEFR